MVKREIKDGKANIQPYMLLATISHAFLLPAEYNYMIVPEVFGCSFGICQQVLRC